MSARRDADHSSSSSCESDSSSQSSSSSSSSSGDQDSAIDSEDHEDDSSQPGQGRNDQNNRRNSPRSSSGRIRCHRDDGGSGHQRRGGESCRDTQHSETRHSQGGAQERSRASTFPHNHPGSPRHSRRSQHSSSRSSSAKESAAESSTISATHRVEPVLEVRHRSSNVCESRISGEPSRRHETKDHVERAGIEPANGHTDVPFNVRDSIDVSRSAAGAGSINPSPMPVPVSCPDDEARRSRAGLEPGADDRKRRAGDSAMSSSTRGPAVQVEQAIKEASPPSPRSGATAKVARWQRSSVWMRLDKVQRQKYAAATLPNTWIGSTQADLFFGAMVVLHACALGIEVEFKLSSASGSESPSEIAFAVVEVFFCLIFSAELGLRFASGGLTYLCSKGGTFDSMLLFLSWCDFVSGLWQSDDVPRLEFAVRLVRLTRCLQNPQILCFSQAPPALVPALMRSAAACVWAMILLALLCYCGALICASSFGAAQDDEIAAMFGSVPRSVFTHIKLSWLEDWPLITASMEKQSWAWRWYCASFICMAHFILLTCLTGTICHGVLTLTRQAGPHSADAGGRYVKTSRERMVQLLSVAGMKRGGAFTEAQYIRWLKTARMNEVLLLMGIDLPLSSAQHLDVVQQSARGRINDKELLNGLVSLRGTRQSRGTQALQLQLRRSVDRTSRTMRSLEKHSCSAVAKCGQESLHRLRRRLAEAEGAIDKLQLEIRRAIELIPSRCTKAEVRRPRRLRRLKPSLKPWWKVGSGRWWETTPYECSGFAADVEAASHQPLFEEQVGLLKSGGCREGRCTVATQTEEQLIDTSAWVSGPWHRFQEEYTSALFWHQRLAARRQEDQFGSADENPCAEDSIMFEESVRPHPSLIVVADHSLERSGLRDAAHQDEDLVEEARKERSLTAYFKPEPLDQEEAAGTDVTFGRTSLSSTCEGSVDTVDASGLNNEHVAQATSQTLGSVTTAASLSIGHAEIDLASLSGKRTKGRSNSFMGRLRRGRLHAGDVERISHPKRCRGRRSTEGFGTVSHRHSGATGTIPLDSSFGPFTVDSTQVRAQGTAPEAAPAQPLIETSPVPQSRPASDVHGGSSGCVGFLSVAGTQCCFSGKPDKS